MKLKPVEVEFRTDTDPPLYATASYDSEFNVWSAHISLACHTGAPSPEAAIGDLGILARKFAEYVEEAERGGLTP